MKKLLLVLVVFVLVVAVYRERIFLRDPLGKVERNGVRVENANVYINYSNDVLVEDTAAAGRYIVQHGSVPGIPKKLNCLRGVICWTDADVAAVFPLGGAAYRADVVMTDREVSFRDGSGEGVRVQIR